MRRLVNASVIVGALLAAGCGSDTSESGNSKDPAGAQPKAATAATDPCILVTADEVGTIIGDKIVATKKAEGSCEYQTAKEGGAAGKDVEAMLSESGDTPKIGDEAFFGANSELSVRKGASYIAIAPPIMRSRMAAGNPLLSADDKKKMALAIAEKAVSRLP